MFKFNFALLLILSSTSIFAQSSSINYINNYNPHDLFSPIEYPVGDNITRSANGNTTSGYWQNKADYKIDVRLDDVKNEISGCLILNYKNNIPHNL